MISCRPATGLAWATCSCKTAFGTASASCPKDTLIKFVSTVAPAWKADGRPVYDGFFWINETGTLPVPKEAYYMDGAGGQTTLMIPSHNLVVVRLGHFKGAAVGGASFRKSLALLMEAVPASR